MPAASYEEYFQAWEPAGLDDAILRSAYEAGDRVLPDECELHDV